MERLEINSDRVRRQAQMVKTRFQQFFSSEMPAWAFFLDFVVFPPLVLWCLYRGVTGAGAGGAVLGLAGFLAGVAIWTLAEYLIHRFAFHHAPVIRPIHMAHHAAPRDLNGTPTIVTVLLFAVLVYWPLTHLVSTALAAALTGGLMAGYLGYVTVHYVVHHKGSGGSKLLRRLIKLHAMHHHDEHGNFGVTSAFWDRVFGTYTGR